MVFLKLFRLTCWPSALLFLLAGTAAAGFAFVTVNLFSQSLAAAQFVSEHGWEAIRHGVLWQVLQLVLWGALALASWLVFKICEHLLGDRYIAWSKRKR